MKKARPRGMSHNPYRAILKSTRVSRRTITGSVAQNAENGCEHLIVKVHVSNRVKGGISEAFHAGQVSKIS